MSDDSSISELEDRIDALSERVAHLERETDTSFEEHVFRNRVSSITPDHCDIEVKDAKFGGYHAHVVGLQTSDLNYAIDEVEHNDSYEDFGWEMTETSDGLGIEIFTEVY